MSETNRLQPATENFKRLADPSGNAISGHYFRRGEIKSLCNRIERHTGETEADCTIKCTVCRERVSEAFTPSLLGRGLKMIINAVQRTTRSGKTVYKPLRPFFDRSEFSVEALDFTTAKDFVCKYHYAKSVPATRRSFGSATGNWR